jgi:ribosomal RNA assembly protein
MQSLYITKERVNLIRKDKGIAERIKRDCRCKVNISPDDMVEVSGEAFDEFSARNVLQAFGRGFDIDIACLLLNDDFYFTSIDLGQILGSDKRIQQVKARIIGIGGKTKRYIESVSQAKLSVYGDTVSFIGTASQINEAQTAVDTLIDGGTHRIAYLRMETAHRKNKEQARSPAF